MLQASLVAKLVKNSPTMQETQILSLGWEDPLEEGNDYPLQCSCLENSMDRGAWQATVDGVTESDTTELLAYTNAHTHATFQGPGFNFLDILNEHH